MSGEPKLLVWNYTVEEKSLLDDLLQRIGAPGAVSIEASQGHLRMSEIIDGSGERGENYVSGEKAILFYNVPQKGVFFLIDTFKKVDLPRPIYAVVTEHSIEWPFCKLLEHLVEEREKAGKMGGPSA